MKSNVFVEIIFCACALSVLIPLSVCQVASTSILNSYSHGVEHFNDTLITLLNYNEEEDLKEFFTEVFQSVKSSHQSFSLSQAEATAQHAKLNQDQARVQSQIDSQRSNLQSKTVQKAAKDKELQSQQQSLQQAERHLQNTEQNLRNLEGAVREAQKKVDDARHCLHKRKKRGFGLGSIVKRVRNVGRKVRKEVKRAGRKIEKNVVRKPAKLLERAICGAYNKLTGNLRDKKRLRDQAKRDVANYRNVVTQARKNVQNTQTAINTLNQQIQSVQTVIATLNKEIPKLATKQKQIIAIKQKISQVDQFLATLVNRMGTSVDAIKTSQAALLIAEIEDVIDFDNVIKPLIEAGELISGQIGPATGIKMPKLFQWTSGNRQKLAHNIAALLNKLDALQEQYGDDSNLFESLSSL